MIRISSTLLICTMLLFSACNGGDEPSYDEQMAEQHEGDSPEATAIAMEPITPVEADMVTYGEGEGVEATGYMATPQYPDSILQAMQSDEEALPALIIIHEWWGLNDNIQLMARRFAGEGFRTLAIDLYNGQVAETQEQAQEAMAAATENPEVLDSHIRAAYQYLTEIHDAPEVAVLGWCFGGTMALRSAVLLPTELDAAVIYYGRLNDVEREHLEAIDMPILAFFGDEDESIPVDSVREFESTLNELDKDAEVHIYEGAGHAFANPSGQNFVEEHARDAWDRTASFLREHLYGAEELRDQAAAQSTTE